MEIHLPPYRTKWLSWKGHVAVNTRICSRIACSTRRCCIRQVQKSACQCDRTLSGKAGCDILTIHRSAEQEALIGITAGGRQDI